MVALDPVLTIEFVVTDENILIQQAAHANDSAAFGQLIEKYQQRVYGYLLRLSRDRSWADDLAQDTFLHAWRKLAGFSGTGSFEGWLLRVAHSIFLQAIRKRKNRREQALESPDMGEAVNDSTATEIDLETLLAGEVLEIRSMLILVYGYGYTFEETAAVVAMPAGTVKSHVSRAKKRIQERMRFAGQGITHGEKSA